MKDIKLKFFWILGLVFVLTACGPESRKDLKAPASPDTQSDTGEVNDGGDTAIDERIQRDVQAFLVWCDNQTITDEARQTIRVILETFKTTDCAVAARTISTEKRLKLSRRIVGHLGPIIAIQNIADLDLSYTGVTPNEIMRLRELPRLKKLNISGNHFSGLSLNSKTLEELDASRNNISVMALMTPSLKKLYLSHNSIKKLPVFPREIEDLDLSDNPLRRLNNQLLSIRNLERLSLRDTRVKKLDNIPPSVEEFDIGGTPLDDPFFNNEFLKFRRFRNLKKVYLENQFAAEEIRRVKPQVEFVFDQDLF